ncbi:unnamed protein product [Heligmosomoides polygyrus]|uniref:Fibronectin type-III domain-containing protein n=1 Tax=Heligmosomoides polygyrus TaxID=6339 RepID=A0A3P8D3G7_HELPZ|nr:unnamed protein product [Heligmosomoides polygyrus]
MEIKCRLFDPATAQDLAACYTFFAKRQVQTKYTIKVWKVDDPSNVKHFETGPDVSSGVILDGLEPDTEYSVQVAAEFYEGDSLATEPATVRTPPGGKEPSREEIKLAERMVSILKDFKARQLEIDEDEQLEMVEEEDWDPQDELTDVEMQASIGHMITFSGGMISLTRHCARPSF